MTTPFKHRGNGGGGAPGKILVPCPKHKKLPDEAVCSSCLAEMGEFIQVAQDTLMKMPQVYGELFTEGMGYFHVLELIAHDPNMRSCFCTAQLMEDGTTVHSENCVKGAAIEAIKGFESRILHRPAEGKLAELKKDAEKWAPKEPAK